MLSRLVTGNPYKYSAGKDFELVSECWKCHLTVVHHIFSLHYVCMPWRMTRMCVECEAVWVEDVSWRKVGK